MVRLKNTSFWAICYLPTSQRLCATATKLGSRTTTPKARRLLSSRSRRIVHCRTKPDDGFDNTQKPNERERKLLRGSLDSNKKYRIWRKRSAISSIVFCSVMRQLSQNSLVLKRSQVVPH